MTMISSMLSIAIDHKVAISVDILYVCTVCNFVVICHVSQYANNNGGERGERFVC